MKSPAKRANFGSDAQVNEAWKIVYRAVDRAGVLHAEIRASYADAGGALLCGASFTGSCETRPAGLCRCDLCAGGGIYARAADSLDDFIPQDRARGGVASAARWREGQARTLPSQNILLKLYRRL